MFIAYPETLHSSVREIQMIRYSGKNQLDVLEMPPEDSIDCLNEYPCCPQMPPSLLTVDHSWACSFVLIETSLAGLSVSRGSLKSFLLPAYSLLLSWLFLKKKNIMRE